MAEVSRQGNGHNRLRMLLLQLSHLQPGMVARPVVDINAFVTYAHAIEHPGKPAMAFLQDILFVIAADDHADFRIYGHWTCDSECWLRAIPQIASIKTVQKPILSARRPERQHKFPLQPSSQGNGSQRSPLGTKSPGPLVRRNGGQ